MMIEDDHHYERERFASVSAPGRVFSHVSFSDCSFTKCAFLESLFRKCSFINCSFRGCDLSVAKVPNTSFVNCRFVDSKAIGIDWTKAGGVQSKLELSLEFEGCNVSYSNFFGLSHRGLLHFGQTSGRPGSRGSHSCPHRHRQPSNFTMPIGFSGSLTALSPSGK